MSFTVGQVARLAGVTVRTLHHYDEIGLLSPGDRSRTGYRRYGPRELERLQQIMFYRELGFALDDIAALVTDPDAKPIDHLDRQRALLVGRRDRVQQMIDAVDRAMEADRMGIALTPEERFEVFGENDPEQYADEARERWGETDAYKESQRRTKAYTKQDWQDIKAETDAINEAFVAALGSGQPATSPAAMDVAERHRRQIAERFYPCSHEFHRCLGDMYIADPRFTATYEQMAPGLAGYVRDAIAANADRHAS